MMQLYLLVFCPVEEYISADSKIYILESEESGTTNEDVIFIVQFAMPILVKLELEFTLCFANISRISSPLIHHIVLK